MRRKDKHKVKRNRNKPRALRQSSASSSISIDTLNNSNRFPSLLSNNPPLSLSPNPFASRQPSVSPTATQNPSAFTATKRAENPTLTEILALNPPGCYFTATGMCASNGISQYGNTCPGQSLTANTIANESISTQKSMQPMPGISASLSNRVLGKVSRGGGAPKRLV